MERCDGRQGDQESTPIHSIQQFRGDSAVRHEPTHDDAQQAAEAFIAELRHWREVAGFSQKALARLVGYTPSYVSKVERGSIVASREFAENADRATRAGRAIVRRWRDMRALTGETAAVGHHEEPPQDDPQSAAGTALIVEHEDAVLIYNDGIFETRIRRQLRNVGAEPVSRYLIRIAVDRHPGDPERSNRLYREHPLTWEEISLTATCRDEPMTWRVKHDRDAFKEVWLLFENGDGRFPLYPGDTTWITYSYTVSADKWGPWWQRAIRLPTRRLRMHIDFPAELQSSVWGIETSMTAEASPFRTPLVRDTYDDRVTYTWSTDDPPLHARYRVEWKFKASAEGGASMETMSPSERMNALGIVQLGDPVLTTQARRFELPAEAEDARRVVAQLVSTLERVSQVHTFSKGMGLAAPQIGISRSAAVIRTPDGDSITLLNPRIIDESAEEDQQYEGCLSFFDIRGMVPRQLEIEVEHQTVDGVTRITTFDHGTARLVAHEIDHLQGILYRTRMRPGADLIPVGEYKGTGRQWAYDTTR
jgi:peptide deformylase